MAKSQWCAAAILCGAIVAFRAAVADTNSVQGLITGNDGKPLAHAAVRAERTDAAGKSAVTTTDSKGHYIFTALPAGKYSITVVAERSSQQPTAATATITAGNGQPIRHFISPLPYQVKADFRAGTPVNVRSRYVWKPAEFGSHIGGRWIKVAEVADPSSNPSQTLENGDLSTAPYLRVNSLR